MTMIYLIQQMNIMTMNELTTTEFDDVGFDISQWELEMMMSPDDGSFFELFSSEEGSEGTASPAPSTVDEESHPLTARHSCTTQEYYDSSCSPLDLPASFSTIEVFAPSSSPAVATLYRQGAIERWLAKRSRRCFRKKTVCKARKDYAETRQRRGGRFVKSTAPGWVSITQVNEAV
jgi:hypothetical protein